MDFHGKSSTRSSSSVSAAELSQYNTHLILALPSWEEDLTSTSSYKDYFSSSFAEGLMNAADNKVSLEIPLNTQMKIFAFLFKENYSMSELFSGTREVGYYGESQPFSIDAQTNNLSLGISLQSTDTTTGDGDGADPGTGIDNETDTGIDNETDTGTGTDTGIDNETDTGIETGTGDNLAPTAPSVSGTTPTTDQTPTWSWNSGGGGNGTYRYKLDSTDLTSGATQTTDTSYTPGDNISTGTHVLYVQERDAVGNWSSSGSSTIVIDNTAPTVTLTDDHSDLRVKDADNVVITATFNDNMTSAPTISIDVAVGTDADISATAMSGSGTTWTYTFDVPSGHDGNATVTVAGTDVAGNAYAGSDTIVYIIDNTAPTQTVSSVSLSADTGTSSTDEITKTASQTISGTLSGALASGDILYGSVNNGSSWTDITSKVSSDTAISWNGATLSGSDNIVFKITDGTGNDSSTTGTTAYVLDTTAPTLLSITMSDDHMDSTKCCDTSPYNSTITFTFSEATSDSVFTAADITTPVGLGSIGSTLDGSGALYTATFTPTPDIYNNDNTNKVTVGQNWTDLAGNAPAANSTSNTFIVETDQ